MAKNERLENINKKLERDKKIKQEINRLNKIYKELPKEEKKIMDGLVQEAAFMKIQLEETRIDILENGLTEQFEQGSQKFERERPLVKTYLSFIQRYTAVMKQIIDYMPGGSDKDNEKSELALFIQQGQALRNKKK